MPTVSTSIARIGFLRFALGIAGKFAIDQWDPQRAQLAALTSVYPDNPTYPLNMRGNRA
jgi:hypothetical protein